jgi:hypothetical protein
MNKFRIVSAPPDPEVPLGIITSLPLSPDVSLFAMGNSRGVIELKKKIRSLEWPESAVDCTAMYDTADRVESYIKLSSDQEIDRASVTCLTLLSASGRYFASANNYGEIRGWRVESSGSEERLALAFLVKKVRHFVRP